MIELIENSRYKEVASRVGEVLDISDSNISETAMTKYNFLVEYFRAFTDLTQIEIFYNKYAQFCIYVDQLKKRGSFDAGLEQQKFKMLEEANEIPEIDWGVVEYIENNLDKLQNV